MKPSNLSMKMLPHRSHEIAS